MKSITLKGLERESVGKKQTKALRNAGLVPCVIYGGEKVTHFAVEHKQLQPLVYTADALMVLVELEGGKKFKAAMQDLQFHPVSDELLHLDFVELNDSKEFTMDIPVKIVGNSKGVRAGGILAVNVRKLPVRALPAKMPDTIDVDITNLEIGNRAFAKDLANNNYKILAPESLIVAHVRMSRAAAKAAQDAAKPEAKK